MKTISLTAQGHTPNLRESLSNYFSFLKRKSLTLAAISAAITYLGALLDSDIITYVAAFIGLCFLYLTNNNQKEAQK